MLLFLTKYMLQLVRLSTAGIISSTGILRVHILCIRTYQYCLTNTTYARTAVQTAHHACFRHNTPYVRTAVQPTAAGIIPLQENRRYVRMYDIYTHKVPLRT